MYPGVLRFARVTWLKICSKIKIMFLQHVVKEQLNFATSHRAMRSAPLTRASRVINQKNYFVRVKPTTADR